MSLQQFTDPTRPSPAQQQAMDSMYRLQRHIYDASRHYYLLGRDRLISGLNVPDGGTVLEIGCGTGRNLIHVARRYPSARVFGVDISFEMLKSADAAIAKSGFEARIRTSQGDALTFESARTFGIPAFDRVYFSYTLSMIPDWRGALAHAATLMADGGQLHITDFGQCEHLPNLFRTGLFAWLRQFHVAPRGDLALEVSRLAERRGALSQFDIGHRGYDWHLAILAEAN